MYWRSMAAIAIVGVALSLALALTTKRVWRSEATLLYRDVIQTGQQAGGGTRAARLGPKLKDMVFARAKLASVIEEHALYPEKTARSMVEAVTEMQSHLGFRARDSDSYVISFSHHDPVTAQRVAGRLADLIVEEYRRENLTSATMTRDFLRRELAQATERVDEASRALATFLAKNPQFQWGLGDSPYAPVPQGAAGAQPAPAKPLPAAPPRSVDPELAALERRLAHVEAKLSPPQPAPAPGDAPLPDSVADAQKARDAAAASLAAAEAALADKLRVVTPLHPDATAAQGRADAARRELAAAESALRMVRGGVRPPPSGEAELGELGAADRAALEKERASLFRQIAARRSRLIAERQGAPRTGTGTGAGTGAGTGTGTGTGAATPEEQAVNDVVELETEWHRLRLDLDRAREALKTVQANERAASLSAEAAERKGDTEMAILDPAYLPARPDKGRGRVFFAGVAMSLMLAFGLAGARVLLNDTLYDEADVDALGGPPVLAAMPPIPEPQAPRARTMVPLTTVPPAANSPAGEPDDEPESDDEVDQRLHAVTLRWGSPLDADEPMLARPAAAPIVRVAMAPLARTRPPIDPDVEEIGDDPADDGHGAIELLRQAPPAAQAALRVLRHRLEQRRGDEHMVVSVVSPGQAEGKTTVAARLAMTLAEAERARVILVEGNLARPRVATTLGLKLPDYAGLSYQIRQRMLGKASTPGAPGQARAHVAPGQTGLPQRPLGVVRIAPSLWVLAEPALGATYPDVVHSPYFGAALQSLRRCFDYVIIDGPAVLGSGDANVLEDAADGIVLVARASMTRGSSLTRAMAQLGDRRILGVVLNDVSERPVARKRIVTAPGQEDAVV